ncbi:LssY C-terminal domain-containing protein [Aestuariivirga sp.]|uniref:LssY C-terminal domain-containing protein n=1 Tax=Aestuariivirga sp. TaxID=2650926 RepID=UPI00359318CD
MDGNQIKAGPRRRSGLVRTIRAAALIVVIYVVAAYIVLPRLWYHHEHQPGLAAKPALTTTPSGIPGDPLNVGLVGDQADVVLAMHEAGWNPADPITLKSSIEIAGSVVFDRPYADAPVSTLLYEGRKQDLAFEKPIGGSADKRNHVRFWKVIDKGVEGRPVWLGSATLDHSVGFNDYTGQFTHHIAPDVDGERGRLIADLVAVKVVTALYDVSGVGPTLNGRNGEGDRYYTDGEIHVAVLSPGAAPVSAPPQVKGDTPVIALKNGVWKTVSGWLAN